MKQIINTCIILFVVVIMGIGTSFGQDITTSFDISSTCVDNASEYPIKLAIAEELGNIKIKELNITFYYDPSYIHFDSMSYVNPRFTLDESFQVTSGIDSVNIFWSTASANGANINTSTYFKALMHGLNAGPTLLTWALESYYIDLEDNMVSTQFETANITIYENSLGYEITTLDSCCANESRGRAVVEITEGIEPYGYLWESAPPQYEPYAVHLATGYTTVSVFDGNNCYRTDSAFIPTNPVPEISFECDPNPAFVDKPVVEFVNTSVEGTDWLWTIYGPTGTIIGSSIHRDTTFIFPGLGMYTVTLTGFDENGFECDTTVSEILEVKPPTLEVKNVISPNSVFKVELSSDSGDEDGIPLQSAFLSHQIMVRNRYGKKVYESTDFPSEGWDGDGKLIDGTYYYILTCEGIDEEYTYKGVITVVGMD